MDNITFDDVPYNNELNFSPNTFQSIDDNDNQHSLNDNNVNRKCELHSYNDNQSNKIYKSIESNQNLLEQEIYIKQTQSTLNKNENNNKLNHTPFISLNEKYRGKKRKDPLNKRPIHDATSPDNIITNIFHRIYNNSLNYINHLLTKEKKLRLKKINSKYLKAPSKEKKLEFLNKTLKDFLSLDISPKFGKKEYNKEIIESIFKENENENIIKIQKLLNKNFEDISKIYCEKDKNGYIFKDFKFLIDDSREDETKGKDQNLIKKTENIAENLKEYIEAIRQTDKKRTNSNQ